ncbi:bifunctional 4-hydroxy-2-oxoglutarate aldolase/2-dehydro-3-deoxy-phosphogluconate aldolase [Cyanobacterium stanieri LEGE 03274]|uniref:Bifunctional 4-hydroxy-2-oxoglutarate aldolase/2-dehydro-3-deoxy-phosphogluconate aldolase n=2 Tax=Cyanobacterium TaxID=102234 RepID=A0ABR9V0L8_9CHRO|nr:bifunctional 4-hydroxy-2-oxoglutarate aldolase/2-dehydro-3-deoxy-phosphogluconate aldolase [Cyanobacterium stanieri]MBE9221425.1 bifunctional 4-hydroxy-2-oxoglutarate aldolase/2-dehydro-3-deoxy-phosphogluconate aldolase [Cyanobacterium stanieri LEGE 03274]
MLHCWLSLLKKYRLIAVIRAQTWELGKKMAHTAADAGIKLIEITWNSYQPAKLVHYLRQQLPDCYIGVGTILTMTQLEDAIKVGAQFAFSPHFNQDLITFAHHHHIPFTPGTLSPTEIINAFNGGAKAVKVFPIQALGGVSYIKSLQGPMAGFPLIPTGGVTIAQTIDFLEAGAIAVGLSGDLFPLDLVKAQQWEVMGDRIYQLRQKINLPPQ